jgi:hypothetical protein
MQRDPVRQRPGRAAHTCVLYTPGPPWSVLMLFAPLFPTSWYVVPLRVNECAAIRLAYLPTIAARYVSPDPPAAGHGRLSKSLT